MTVTQVKTSACETQYTIEHNGDTYGLRLWAIVGGRITLSFDDYSFQKRYHIDERFTTDNHVKNCCDRFWHYKHQDRQNIIGPQIGDALSQKEVENFLEERVPLRNLRTQRAAQIRTALGWPYYLTKSCRFHNKDYREYFYLSLLSEWGEDVHW